MRKENKGKGDHAPQREEEGREEEIFWAKLGQRETAFRLKWKWSTERRGATLSALAVGAMNDASGRLGMQLNMQRRRWNGRVIHRGG